MADITEQEEQPVNTTNSNMEALDENYNTLKTLAKTGTVKLWFKIMSTNLHNYVHLAPVLWLVVCYEQTSSGLKIACWKIMLFFITAVIEFDDLKIKCREYFIKVWNALTRLMLISCVKESFSIINKSSLYWCVVVFHSIKLNMSVILKLRQT